MDFNTANQVVSVFYFEVFESLVLFQLLCWMIVIVFQANPGWSPSILTVFEYQGATAKVLPVKLWKCIDAVLFWAKSCGYDF